MAIQFGHSSIIAQLRLQGKPLWQKSPVFSMLFCMLNQAAWMVWDEVFG